MTEKIPSSADLKDRNQENRTSSHKSAYRYEIDGLRAFSVLSVVAFHAFPSWLTGGFIGVDVFFVISGFLITTHIFQNLDKGLFSFADFFSRRIRRIFPALILVMACSLGFGWFVLLADEYEQLSKHVASGATFITNFILVNESGYFDNAAETKPMLHLWSLAVEEQFYIVWPLVLWLAWKKQLNLLTVTIGVAALSFYLNVRFITTHPSETFFYPIGRFWEILSGSILAWLLLYKGEELGKFKLWLDKYLVRIVHTKDVVSDGSTVSNLMSFSGLFLLVYGVIRIDENLAFPSEWALIPVLGAIFIIASGPKPWLNRVLLMNPTAVWFGLISYPLYLWHWPVLSYLQIIYGEFPPRNARIVAVILSVLLAFLTFRFVENPIRFGGNKTLRSKVLFATISLMGFISIYIYKNDGHTSYNTTLSYISEANGDWDYPNGLVKKKGYLSTSKKKAKVLLLGDSHIQAFGPRVVKMYKEGLLKEVAFVTRGGCAPLPNSFRSEKRVVDCATLFTRFEQVLKTNPIETIILGGSYPGYFNGNNASIYVEDNGDRIKISSKQGRQKAITAFYDFVEKLSKKYKVIVLSHAATSKNFAPINILGTDDNRRSIPLGSNINNKPFPIDNNFEIEMKGWLEPLNVQYVSQSEKICPKGICTPLTDDGKPKYKDDAHMRPFFVKEYVDMLDSYMLLSD